MKKLSDQEIKDSILTLAKDLVEIIEEIDEKKAKTGENQENHKKD